MSIVLIVHLEVHHVYQERGPEYQHFGVHRKPLVVSNLKVVSVRERFPETTIPLLGDDGQRGAVSVEDVEDDVITEREVAPRPSHLQHLGHGTVTHYIKVTWHVASTWFPTLSNTWYTG